MVGGTLEIRAPSVEFGAAEVRGLEPGRPYPSPVVDEIRSALWTHALVCIRLDAPLADDNARALAAMIGPIKDPIGRTRTGSELRYGEDRQIIDAGFVLTDELRAQLGDVSFGGDALRPGLFETFHTDDTYTERPAVATVLHARELPATPGGDTTFIDMRAAYRLLDDETRARLAGRRAVHAYNNRGAFPPRVPATGPHEDLVDVDHPIVRAHHVTGAPALYFDLDRATHVVGMPETEGRKLLQALQDHAEGNAPRYAHRWQPHDVLMWDNSAVQHRAGGDFPVGEPRRFWRYMIEGEIPIGYVDPAR